MGTLLDKPGNLARLGNLGTLFGNLQNLKTLLGDLGTFLGKLACDGAASSSGTRIACPMRCFHLRWVVQLAFLQAFSCVLSTGGLLPFSLERRHQLKRGNLLSLIILVAYSGSMLFVHPLHGVGVTELFSVTKSGRGSHG